MKQNKQILSLWALCLLIGSMAFASIAKLQETQMPLFSLLIEAFNVEGEAFNLSDETGAMPYYHSAQWNPTDQILAWRFWVPAEGELYETLQSLPRPKAISLLKGEMNDLAVFVGLEAMTGFDQPLGSIHTANIPGRQLLTEQEWASARTQLAKASAIFLAAPHPEGPILLKRSPGGQIQEAPVSPASSGQK